MSHLIVEVPKFPQVKASWIWIIPENWIVGEIMYYPSKSISAGYANQLIISGAPPDTEEWDEYDNFEVLHQFRK